MTPPRPLVFVVGHAGGRCAAHDVRRRSRRRDHGRLRQVDMVVVEVEVASLVVHVRVSGSKRRVESASGAQVD